MAQVILRINKILNISNFNCYLGTYDNIFHQERYNSMQSSIGRDSINGKKIFNPSFNISPQKVIKISTGIKLFY